ncbi:LAME_0E00804g1_1 [Lachancea meyersii CBS 8951]|uniref:LAME_0E00804g1_1 n=1 Tax=Lachancea meyersii CBS 8951 TaxID=1266667 RepID=A0A1G4JEN4_9SACH|nr:LAME_0E00804g1_1 [Lachancea meyersii CBS 8951]
MTSISLNGSIPTRPGTVYLGKYSFSRETLDKTQDSQELIDFKDPPRTARSLRSTIRRAWVKPLEPLKPSPPATRHHRFRRWLNKRERDFTCSWSEAEELAGMDTQRFAELRERSEFKNEYGGLEADDLSLPSIGFKDDCGTEENGLDMFSRIYLDSDSGATLSDNTERSPATALSSSKRRFDLLRSFRLRLHRSRIRNELTLTDRYLGSEENIERCLQEMDLMPFDLTAPSTAGNDSASGDRHKEEQYSGALSDKSTMVEETFRPGTWHIKKRRQ